MTGCNKHNFYLENQETNKDNVCFYFMLPVNLCLVFNLVLN